MILENINKDWLRRKKALATCFHVCFLSLGTVTIYLPLQNVIVPTPTYLNF